MYCPTNVKVLTRRQETYTQLARAKAMMITSQQIISDKKTTHCCPDSFIEYTRKWPTVRLSHLGRWCRDSADQVCAVSASWLTCIVDLNRHHCSLEQGPVTAVEWKNCVSLLLQPTSSYKGGVSWNAKVLQDKAEKDEKPIQT